MSRPHLIPRAIAVIAPALVLAVGATAEAQFDGTRLWAFQDEIVEPLRWRDGARLEIQLPVQGGTTYRWDLVEARSSGATKIGQFFDTTTDPPRFAFATRELTPEERQRFGPRPGGPLGGVDQVQTIPVRLEDTDRVVLTFRQYDILRSGPPGENFIRVVLERRP